MKITICINTFNRNKNLCNLLKSIEKIYLLNSYEVKILIIDNTVNNNSYSFIQKFKSNYKFEITHINEKKNGIVEFADQSKDRAASSAAVRHITSFLKIKTAAPVKVDFFVCTPKEKPFMLFHYTGSRAYNIRTRALAKRKKWKLNQYGLYHFSNRRVKGSGQIKTENDLAKFLGVSYRPPENRIK